MEKRLLAVLLIFAVVNNSCAQYDNRYGSRNYQGRKSQQNKSHNWMGGCNGFVCPPAQICKINGGVPECVEDLTAKHDQESVSEPEVVAKHVGLLETDITGQVPQSHNLPNLVHPHHESQEHNSEKVYHTTPGYNFPNAQVHNSHNPGGYGSQQPHQNPPISDTTTPHFIPQHPLEIAQGLNMPDAPDIHHLSSGNNPDQGQGLLDPHHRTSGYNPQPARQVTPEHVHSNMQHSTPGYNPNEPAQMKVSFDPHPTTPGYNQHHIVQSQDPSNPHQTTASHNPQNLYQKVHGYDPSNHHGTTVGGKQHDGHQSLHGHDSLNIHGTTPHQIVHGHDPSNHHTTPGYNAHHPYQVPQRHDSSNIHRTTPGYNPHLPQHHVNEHDSSNVHQTTPGYGYPHHASQDHDISHQLRTTPGYGIPHYPSQNRDSSHQNPATPGYGTPHHASQDHDSSHQHRTTPGYGTPHHALQDHDSSHQHRTTPGYGTPHYPLQNRDSSHQNPATPGYGTAHHASQDHDSSHQHRTTPGYGTPHHDLSHQHRTTPGYNSQHSNQGAQQHNSHNKPQVPQIYITPPLDQRGGTPEQHSYPQQELYPNLHPSKKPGYPGADTTPQPYHKGYPGQRNIQPGPPQQQQQQYYPSYPYRQNYGNVYPNQRGGYGGYRPTPAYSHRSQ